MRYDLVINGGRVIDPESGLDAVRSIGVTGGRVEALTDGDLSGDETIDAAGMVVAPGFIDLHSHGQDSENYEVQARDGVTTALELEVGAGDIDGWYSARSGTSLVNYGASVGHIPVRIDVMNDPGDFLPVADAAFREATPEEPRTHQGRHRDRTPTGRPRRRFRTGLYQRVFPVGGAGGLQDRRESTARPATSTSEARATRTR